MHGLHARTFSVELGARSCNLLSVTALPTTAMRATRGRWEILGRKPYSTTCVTRAGSVSVMSVATAQWAASALAVAVLRIFT